MAFIIGIDIIVIIFLKYLLINEVTSYFKSLTPQVKVKSALKAEQKTLVGFHIMPF